MADTDRIKRNLSKMIDQGAPESDLNAYLSTEGFDSPEAWRAAVAQPVATEAKPKPVGAAMVRESPRLEPGPRTATMPDLQPSWGEVAGNALVNLPGSIWRDAIVPTYKAITERPLETAESLIRLPVGALENLPQPRKTDEKKQRLATTRPNWLASLDESKALASAVGQDFVDAYGSESAIKHTLSEHPGRVLMDVATVGTAGAALPGKAGQVASVVSKIDPLTLGGNALKYGAKGAELGASNVLGMTTGAGAESIRAAGRAGREGGEAGRAFTGSMRGSVPIQAVVDDAKAAVAAMRQEASDAYKAGKVDLQKDVSVIPFDDINVAVDKAGNVGQFRGQSGTAAPVTMEPAAAETVDKMRGLISAWQALDPAEYHTPVGIDALKRALGNLRDSTGPNTPERVAADRIYRAVRGEITAKAPGYSTMMEAWGNAQDAIKEAERTFSLGERATGDTAARKLLSATRNNVQTNFGQRERLLNVLAEHEPTLPYSIAGQSLNALAPRGLVGRGGAMLALGGAVADPASSLAYLAASSPRIVGEVVYAGGKIVGFVDDVAAALGITPARIRALEVGGYQGGRSNELADRARGLRQINALAAP